MTSLQGLGEALIRLRKQRDLNAREVADRAGITKAMVSSYERERARPSLESLEKVLDGMDADLGDLAEALGQADRWADDAPRWNALAGLLRRPEARAALADTLDSLSRLAGAVADHLREEPAGHPETGEESAAG